METIYKFICEKLDQNYDFLLRSKFYNQDNKMIDGYDILKIALEKIKSFDGEYCYYCDIFDGNEFLLDYDPKPDDWDCEFVAVSVFCSHLFLCISYLDLMPHRVDGNLNRLRWSVLHPYENKMFNNVTIEPEITKPYNNKTPENDPIIFMKILYSIPPEIRDFVFSKTINKVIINDDKSISLFNDDYRISNTWFNAYGFPTTNGAIIKGQWACGKITNRKNLTGNIQYEIIRVSYRKYRRVIDVADKISLIDKVINEIYFNNDEYVKILNNYKNKLKQGVK